MLSEQGTVDFSYNVSPHVTLIEKGQEMRKELRHIEQVLGVLENQARMKAPVNAIKPNMSTLYWWHVSLLESYFSMMLGVLGNDEAVKAYKDLQMRFKRLEW